MRLNHNKKRNTAFLYEVLIKELTVSAINENFTRKNNTINVIKEFFSKDRTLGKELAIYNSFQDLENTDTQTVIKILAEAKKQYASLDKRKIFSEQSRLINEINKKYGKDSWNIFVSNFKDLATLNQILQQKLGPRDQVLLEEKIVKRLTSNSNLSDGAETIKNIDNLTVKKFIEKFNDQYTEKLNEGQKKLLGKYITSYQDGGLDFKLALYEQIEAVKESLQEKLNETDSNTSEKLKKIIERVDNYDSRAIDKSLLTEFLKIQSLVSELNNNGN
tara:strand:- start:26517 stop:27341 length:825 start_codon:yes stop_codon:yes gene_type:complete